MTIIRTLTTQPLATTARFKRFVPSIAVAGVIGASFIGVPTATAEDCGFHLWDQSYTNCHNFNAHVAIMYAMGGGPHGDMQDVSVPYCVPAGQTKKIARPDLGLAQQHVGGDKPC